VIRAVAGDLVSRRRDRAHERRLASREAAHGEERAARAVSAEHLEVALHVGSDARRVALAVRDHRAHILQVDAEEEGACRMQGRGVRHEDSHGSTAVA